MKKYVPQTGIGTLYLAKLDDEDLKPYRENIVAYADTLEDVSKRAFEAFETLSKQLNVAREKSKIYATGLKDKQKQKQTGTDALDAMTAAKDGQEKLINIFENPSPAVTQESKLSDLDKLILEVLKENT
jgi:hypothetical protein